MEPTNMEPLCVDDDAPFLYEVKYNDAYVICDQNDGTSTIASGKEHLPLLKKDMLDTDVHIALSPKDMPSVSASDDALNSLLYFLFLKASTESITFQELFGDVKFVCTRRVLTHLALLPHDSGQPNWTIDVQRFRGVYFLKLRVAPKAQSFQSVQNMMLKQKLSHVLVEYTTESPENITYRMPFAVMNASFPSLATSIPHSVLYSAGIDGILAENDAFYDVFTIHSKHNYRYRFIQNAVKAALIGTDKCVVGHRHAFKSAEIEKVSLIEINKHDKIIEDGTISIPRCFKHVASFLTSIEHAYNDHFGALDGIIHVKRITATDVLRFTVEPVNDTNNILLEDFVNHFTSS